MRPAEVAKIWRAIHKAPRRSKEIRRFEFVSIRGIADGALTFSSPINALCGLNGVGKTALLRAMWAALDWESASGRPEMLERLRGAQIVAVVGSDEEEDECRVDIDASRSEVGAIQVTVLHIDPSLKALEVQKTIASLEGVEELLDAYDPVNMDDEQISILSYVTKKDYQSVYFYEIDEFDETFPFVVLCEDGNKYDSRTMSIGEMSIFLCFWMIMRADPDSIVLLEEPETYISPAAQRSLMDLLAKMSLERRISILLTTHSPQMIAPLSENQLHFIYKANGGSQIAPQEACQAMKRMVGLDSPKRNLLLVEDRGALEFLKTILGKFDGETLNCSEIIKVDGEGNISTARRKIPSGIKAFKVVGLYDGDMRGKIKYKPGEWPLMYLPGARRFEAEFRAIANQRTEELARVLGRDPRVVNAELGALRGRDDHDWYEELVRALHISYEQLMHACLEVWLGNPANRSACEEFCRELRVKLSQE